MEVHCSGTAEGRIGEFWALLLSHLTWGKMCDSVDILWQCHSLGLDWKLKFSSPVATGEFFKFPGILSVALLQSHLLVCEIAPSAPLVFSIVLIHKDGLTSHSKMSGSRWAIIPSWICGYWRSFLYNSSVYYLHLFLIHSASVKSVPFLFFNSTIFAWGVPLVSLIFLNISCLSHCIIFLFFFFLHSSLKSAFLFLLPLLCNTIHMDISLPFPFALASLLFSVICMVYSDTHFGFLHFFFFSLEDGLDHCLLYTFTNVCL